MAISCRRWSVAFAAVISLIGLVPSSHVTELPFCDFEDEFMGGNVSGNLQNSRCMPLRGSNLTLIHDRCLDYLPEDKCYIYNYGIDFEQTDLVLSILDRTAQNADYYIPACIEFVRAYICNYVYPKCNPATGNYEGVCRGDCIMYVLNDACSEPFNDLATVAQTVPNGFPFSHQCNNTLNYLDQFISDFVYNPDECFNISGVLANVSLPVPQPLSTSNLTVIILSSLSAVVLLVFTAAVLSLIYINRRRKRRNAISLESSNQARRIFNNYHSVTLQSYQNQYEEIDYFQLSSEDMDLVGTNQQLRNAIVGSDQLEITGDLGEGAFGHVFKGIFKRNPEEAAAETIPVAVKTIKNCASYDELKAFLLESALMCTFDHPHVLGLIGICFKTNQRSPYLILPYMKNGDLRTYLKGSRDYAATSADTGYPDGLEYPVLMKMCYEIACGMEYLATNKLVHRDLAARNCMVDADLQVKVADFGLTRDIYATDYYRQSHQGRVPIKWMSIESLHDRISNEKTDVWSYGVTCWEVFSLGRTPYPSVANHEMIDYLEQGLRLKKPVLCGENMYDLMYQCWKEDPTARPTFAEIVGDLEGILQQDNSPLTTFAMDASMSNEKLCSGAPCQSTHVEDWTLQMNADSPGSSCHLQEKAPALEEPSDCYTGMKPAQEVKCSPLVIANGLNAKTEGTANAEYVNTPPQHSILCENNTNDYDSSPALSAKYCLKESKHALETDLK